MKITAIKTNKIKAYDKTIFEILDKYVDNLEENSILAITSLIVSLCENRVVDPAVVNKQDLIKQEADLYLPSFVKKGVIGPAIINNVLLPEAGIDESNGNGYYVLLPKNPQRTANTIRMYLERRFSLKKVGVIITDSRIIPLRWGTVGVAIAHSGFKALKDYVGKPDVFGRILQVSISNIADSLASAAVLNMGEGNEQTPLALIEDVPMVEFTGRNPSKNELALLHVGLNDPMYAPFFKKAHWKKGMGK